MSKETATAEEVAAAFLSTDEEEGSRRLYAYLYADMKTRETEYLYRGCLKNVSAIPGFESKPPHDKLCAIMKAAFIIGFTNAATIYYIYARRAYNKLFEIPEEDN